MKKTSVKLTALGLSGALVLGGVGGAVCARAASAPVGGSLAVDVAAVGLPDPARAIGGEGRAALHILHLVQDGGVLQAVQALGVLQPVADDDFLHRAVGPCMLMARGALISMASVILILPALLLLCDRLVCATTAGMRHLNRKNNKNNDFISNQEVYVK